MNMLNDLKVALIRLPTKMLAHFLTTISEFVRNIISFFYGIIHLVPKYCKIIRTNLDKKLYNCLT